MLTRFLILRTNDYFSGSRGALEGVGATRSITDLSMEVAEERESKAEVLRADPTVAALLDADALLSLVRPRGSEVGALSSLKQVGRVKFTDGLIAVGADTTALTGEGVTVAVLDTGLDVEHPAFGGKQIIKRNFTGGKASDVTDTDGHGTHCAATICGAEVDGARVGVAPGVKKLCVGKVLGQAGGTLEMLLRAMHWAVVDKRAQIVSMSLGYDLPGNTRRLVERGSSVELATNAALRQQAEISKGVALLRSFLEFQSPNVIFTSATGNESERPAVVLDAGLPASQLFSVGAVGAVSTGAAGGAANWRVANFSNARPDVVAPGVDVLSAARGGGWMTMSGTSMATPHVAGVAALWIEKLRRDGTADLAGSLVAALRATSSRALLVDRDSNAIGAGMVQAPQL